MGSGSTQEFARQCKAEFYEFVCGGKKYAEDRAKLQKLQKPTELLVVSTIAVSLGPHVGAAAALLGPAVGAFLMAATKVGISAWCKANKPADETAIG